MSISDLLRERDNCFYKDKEMASQKNEEVKGEIKSLALSELYKDIEKGITRGTPESVGGCCIAKYNLTFGALCQSAVTVDKEGYEESKFIADFGKEIENNIFTDKGFYVKKSFELAFKHKRLFSVKKLFKKKYYHLYSLWLDEYNLSFLRELFDYFKTNRLEFSSVEFTLSDFICPVRIKINSRMTWEEIEKALSFKQLLTSYEKNPEIKIKETKISLTIKY